VTASDACSSSRSKPLASTLICPCLPLSAPGSTPGAVSANVERGMARQGYDLQLTRYEERGWRATFYTSGMEHSITSGVYSACFWRCRRGQSRDGR